MVSQVTDDHAVVGRESRRRNPLWMRLVIVAGALLMTLSGTALVAAKTIMDEAVGSIDQVEIDVAPGDKSVVVRGEALEGTLNILLVGIDDGQADGGELRTEEPLADSIMILHVPRAHDRGYVVSLPRDLWVEIPAYEKTGYWGGFGKLNSAFMVGYGAPESGGPGRAGGLELLMKTISNEVGISFNSAAIVNFTGFTAALRQLGGVTMYIDERVTSVHYGWDKAGNPCVPAFFDDNAVAHRNEACHPRVFERGVRRLDPQEALDYTRQREWMELGDGDYGRQRHQQQFIRALVREARAQGFTTNPAKALGLIKSVGGALTVWTNGAKVEDWFFTLKDLAGSDIVMVKTNNGWFHEAQVAGTSAESLSHLSVEMFAALRDERIDEFLLAHPDWLSRDS